MKLKKLNNLMFSFMAIAAFMAIMLITGCGDKTTVGEKTGGTGTTGIVGPGGTVHHYDVVGVVVTDAGKPIQHVFIDIINYVMSDEGEEPVVASVRSDGNGKFGIRISGDYKISQVTLRFAYQDVVTYVRDVAVTANQEIDLETITLTKMSQRTIEDSTIAHTLTDNVRANANVTIGADALVYSSDGKPFTTAVEVDEDEDPITATVAIGYVDTTTYPELFPDNFYSMDGGSLKLFSTYGILEIKVTTNNGNVKLDLATGQTATISIPVGDLVGTDSPNFPATADLWYYDEDAADWVLEQEDGLTYNAATRSFTGVINHFSTYNAGYTFDSRYYQAIVRDDRGDVPVLDNEGNPVIAKDNDGNPIPELDDAGNPVTDDDGNPVYKILTERYLLPLPGSTVKIFSDTFSPYGVWNATYTAGADGKIPDQTDPSLAGLLYKDDDGYFVQVPGVGGLMENLEYTNPTTGDDGSQGPEAIVFAAGANKYSEVYDLKLSTSAYMSATLHFENGSPADGVAIMFNDPITGGAFCGGVADEDGVLKEGTFSYWTWQWSPKQGGKDLIAIDPEKTGYVIVPRDSAGGANKATPIKEVRLNNANGPLVEDVFSLADSRFSHLSATTYGPWTDYNSLVLSSGTPLIGQTLNLVITLKNPTGDVLYTHLNGKVHIPDGVDPTKLWVVIYGVFNKERPITVRASVDADGNWPADDGTFNPVTVDGVDGLFVQVPSETELTITVADYVTDPLNPKEYYSYKYTSDVDAIRDQDGYITEIVTNSITPAPNAYIEGVVTYDAWLGSGLRIVFTKENPGEDDKPVTVTADASGSFSANLEFGTKYLIEIFDDTDEFNPVRIYVDDYTSNPDGEVDYITDNPNSVVGLIQIGDEYFPIATVSGTVVYDAAYGEDLLVTFTPATGAPVSVITGKKGIYSADLVPDTSYTVTVSEHDAGVATTLLYPSDAYPVDQDAYDLDGTIGELLFTSSDIDSNIAGDEDELDIQIGAPLAGDKVPAIAAGMAGIKGTIQNADGSYLALNSWLRIALADGTFVAWGRIGDEEGTIWAFNAGVNIAPYLTLTPDTDYLLQTTNFVTHTTILPFTTPASGVVETVKIILPAEGTDPRNSAYVKGTIQNADGSYLALNSWLRIALADGTFVAWGRVGDEEGTIWAFNAGVNTAPYLTLTPGTDYLLQTTNFVTHTTILPFTTPAIGVLGSVKIILPAEGTDPINSAYVRGTIANADGSFLALNSWLRIALADGTFVAWGRIGDEEGTVWAFNAGVNTAPYLTLTPGTDYLLQTTNFVTHTTILPFTTPAIGVVKSVGYVIPTP